MAQNTIPYNERYDRRVDPRGRTYFWTSPGYTCPDPHPDSDVAALADGFITVTPLQFNLTAWKTLEEMQGWQWKVPDAYNATNAPAAYELSCFQRASHVFQRASHVSGGRFRQPPIGINLSGTPIALGR